MWRHVDDYGILKDLLVHITCHEDTKTHLATLVRLAKIPHTANHGKTIATVVLFKPARRDQRDLQSVSNCSHNFTTTHTARALPFRHFSHRSARLRPWKKCNEIENADAVNPVIIRNWSQSIRTSYVNLKYVSTAHPSSMGTRSASELCFFSLGYSWLFSFSTWTPSKQIRILNIFIKTYQN